VPTIHPHRQKGVRKMQDEEKKPTNKLPDSRIDVFIFGANVQIHEYYSRDMMDKIIQELKQEYGIELDERCRGMCG